MDYLIGTLVLSGLAGCPVAIIYAWWVRPMQKEIALLRRHLGLVPGEVH